MDMCLQKEKTTWGHSEEVAIWKPQSEDSEEIHSADTTISKF